MAFFRFIELRNGVTGSYGSAVFLSNAQLIFVLAILIYTPTAVNNSSFFPISTLKFVRFLDNSHFDWSELSQSAFNFHFPDEEDVEPL